MSTAQYSGYRALDVTIPAGALSPSARIQLGELETLIAIMTPSDWVTSNIHAQLTYDDGSNWEWVESSAGVKQPYFAPTAASRAYPTELGLSMVVLQDFKLAAAVDQVTPKTLTLWVMKR